MTIDAGSMRAAARPRGPWKVFGVPIAIAVTSGIGLVAGLIGDGWLDVLAWIGLAIPVAACAWPFLDRRRGRPA